MIEIIVSISALVISIFSLVLSFMQGRDKAFSIHPIQMKTLDDSFDLLFDDNNKISIDLINFNNRDLLIYLRDGYVCIGHKQHAVKPMYYTIKANSVTNIEIEISSNIHQSPKTKYKTWLAFQYKGLIFTKTCKYKEKFA